MKRILKRNFLGVTALMLFILAASQTGIAGEEVPLLPMTVEEVPLLPMTVEGVILIDGTPAPVGTVIEAYLNGEQVGKYLTNTSLGDYCFWISGTAEDEGKPITFKVDGKNPEKILTWKSGKQVLFFQLSVGKGVDSGSYAKSFISRINSESLTKIGKPEAAGENYKTSFIESSVPEPNLKALKNMSTGFWDKGVAKSAEDSSKLKSAPGLSIVYAIAGIIVLLFGFNLMRKRG